MTERLIAACTALEQELMQNSTLDRAMDVYDALIITRRLLPHTCARTGHHAKDCPRYVPGHELASPVLRVQRAREELGCGIKSPDGNHSCVLHRLHAGLHSDKTLAEVTPNGERMVWQLPEDVGDRICGDEYDGEECELEPGHAGGHIAGNLGWSYGRAAASYRTA